MLQPIQVKAYARKGIFTVTQLGQVDITLTKTDPLATIILGLAITQTSGGQCIPTQLAFNNNASASTAPQISGTADVGAYCVSLYDIGNVADPVNYTITVTHP